MRARLYCAIPAVALLLTGCAHKRVAGPDCVLAKTELAVERPDGTRPGRSFADILAGGLTPRRAGPREVVPAPALLVLSGGGKWGSFGSGFLAEWRDLPRFAIVTGVSTGALQGTFALLGRDPSPADRLLQPADDFETVATPRTNIEDLVAGYSISREKTLLDSNGGTLGVLRKGSFGDLSPLEKRLDKLITPETLKAVAAEGPGRRFYVALLNADTGKAEAIDMTELATRAGMEGQDPEHVRQCYIRTLIAASSEPVGAQPVFIDGQMYLDAGVRFGVFLEEVATAAKLAGRRRTAAPASAAPAAPQPAPPRSQVYMIVNGDMAVAPEDEPKPKWSALTLAKRSMTLVTDQIYRFSVDRVADWSRNNADFHFAYARGWAEHRWNDRTCASWRDADKAEAKPIQFYPRMMKCLIDYGRVRQRTRPWDAGPGVDMTGER